MVAAPLSLGEKLGAGEIKELVRDLSTTLHVVARAFGIAIAPADDVEAANIAAPAARMLARNTLAQKIIRKVSDPVVLTGAIGGFFASRLKNSPAPPANQTRPVPTVPPPTPPPPSIGAFGLGASPGPATVTPAPPPAPAQEVELRASILDSIARAGMVPL